MTRRMNGKGEQPALGHGCRHYDISYSCCLKKNGALRTQQDLTSGVDHCRKDTLQPYKAEVSTPEIVLDFCAALELFYEVILFVYTA